MPETFIECVPNFSEGRDKNKVGEIVIAAKSVPGVIILDLETDPDHNRSVLTFMAPPDACLEAAFRCAKRASELIDLQTHKGEHPRMGATDVIPFIPVLGASVADCVNMAHRLAERIGRELEIPVYLYGKAARRAEREDLAVVRKGQYEGLRDLIGKDETRTPDFGPNRIHKSAGATAVGARDQIINFNVNLKTTDMALAKKIAMAVRASSGGFPHVRGKEIELKERGLVQVSTVLTNYKQTPMFAVYDRIRSMAKEAGVEIESSEIVGLVPQGAITGLAADELKLEKFEPYAQILENRLTNVMGGWEMASARVADAFATPDPTPGGGSASALAGALGASLGLMVVRVSANGIEKKRENYPDADKRLGELAAYEAQLKALSEDLKSLIAEDARAFDQVMEGYRTPKTDEKRGEKIQNALKVACEVPFKTAKVSLSVLHRLAELEKLAIGTVASDLKVGRHLSRAAIYGAIENVKINLPSIKDPAYTQEKQKAIIDTMKAICD